MVCTTAYPQGAKREGDDQGSLHREDGTQHTECWPRPAALYRAPVAVDDRKPLGSPQEDSDPMSETTLVRNCAQVVTCDPSCPDAVDDPAHAGLGLVPSGASLAPSNS